MITFSGRKVDVANMQKQDICLQDIAKGLSLICRWVGQLGQFYSVAQHSVHMAEHAMSYGNLSMIPKLCLLHDASEAYLADIPYGVKGLLPEYQRLENAVQGAVYDKYLPGVTQEAESALKCIDHRAAVAEYLQLKPNSKREDLGAPHHLLRPLPGKLVPMSPAEAEAAFLNMAEKLGLRAVASRGGVS